MPGAGSRGRGRDPGAGRGARGSRSAPLRSAPGPPGQSPPAMSAAPGGRPAFPGLPGELVLEEAAGARRCGDGGDGDGDGDGSVPGTLLCTNRRVAFLPAQAPGSRVSLRSEDDVALPCIRTLVAASSWAKPKVLTAASTLKFIPEELAVFCRDFRLLRFHFHADGLAPQAFRVANAIAQAREAAAWLGDTGEGHGGWSGAPGTWPEDEEEEDGDEDGDEEDGDEEDEGSGATPLFENLRDWEKELRRLGAEGWRVSAVNERFDMAPSLPRYLWVPSGLLDHDLKRTFAHFQERRVPRLCWHRPGGGHLLRGAAFHPASEPGAEDVRCLEALLLGGRGPCVVADATELPSLADIQLAHLKLRALCLPGAVAEDKWLSALEGTRWLEHVRTCLRRAVEVATLLAGTRCSVLLQEPSDRDLNCLLAALVPLLGDPRCRTLRGFQSLVQREWVAAGHPFPHRMGLLRRGPRDEAPVFLLFLDCVWQLVRQFPAAFGFTEAFLLALHDSSFAPYSSTFLFSCQRQRGRARPPSQTHTPAGGRRPRGGSAAGGLPPVWAWGLRYSREQRARFRNPAGGGAPAPGPPDTADPPSPDTGAAARAGPVPVPVPVPVLVLSRGSLSPQPLPWRSGRPPARGARVAAGGLRAAAGAPPGLLVPCAAGPAVRLWRRCYLRGLPEAQRGRLAPSPAALAEELMLLQDRLRTWGATGPPAEATDTPPPPSR
ncbi:myotubularin-related protein 11 isoform X2 [Columba livia]|uniref:myotubularin-related protein 11 isoform X2 n=1 Tax=Columba livia TaxID=8932 RepID=UPI0031BABB75